MWNTRIQMWVTPRSLFFKAFCVKSLNLPIPFLTVPGYIGGIWYWPNNLVNTGKLSVFRNFQGPGFSMDVLSFRTKTTSAVKLFYAIMIHVLRI